MMNGPTSMPIKTTTNNFQHQTDKTPNAKLSPVQPDDETNLPSASCRSLNCATGTNADENELASNGPNHINFNGDSNSTNALDMTTDTNCTANQTGAQQTDHRLSPECRNDSNSTGLARAQQLDGYAAAPHATTNPTAPPSETIEHNQRQRDSLGQLALVTSDKRLQAALASASGGPGGTGKRAGIVRRFQKFDSAALSSAPSPDVKIGQRVAYKEYYGNEFGTIRWIGRVPQISPDWTVGVEFDNAIGEGDGSLNGRRYFIAKDCFAKFLALASVTLVDQHVGRPEPGTMISVMSAAVRPGQMISIQRVSTVHVQHCFLNAPHRRPGAEFLAVNTRLHCQCPNCGPCAHVVKPPRTQRIMTPKNATHMCQFSTYTCCGMESSDETMCTYTGNKISSEPPPPFAAGFYGSSRGAVGGAEPSLSLPPLGNSWMDGSGYLSQLQAEQRKLMPEEYKLGAAPEDTPANLQRARGGSGRRHRHRHESASRLSSNTPTCDSEHKGRHQHHRHRHKSAGPERQVAGHEDHQEKCAPLYANVADATKRPIGMQSDDSQLDQGRRLVCEKQDELRRTSDEKFESCATNNQREGLEDNRDNIAQSYARANQDDTRRRSPGSAQSLGEVVMAQTNVNVKGQDEESDLLDEHNLERALRTVQYRDSIENRYLFPTDDVIDSLLEADLETLSQARYGRLSGGGGGGANKTRRRHSSASSSTGSAVAATRRSQRRTHSSRSALSKRKRRMRRRRRRRQQQGQMGALQVGSGRRLSGTTGSSDDDEDDDYLTSSGAGRNSCASSRRSRRRHSNLILRRLRSLVVSCLSASGSSHGTKGERRADSAASSRMPHGSTPPPLGWPARLAVESEPQLGAANCWTAPPPLANLGGTGNAVTPDTAAAQLAVSPLESHAPTSGFCHLQDCRCRNSPTGTAPAAPFYAQTEIIRGHLVPSQVAAEQGCGGEQANKAQPALMPAPPHSPSPSEQSIGNFCHSGCQIDDLLDSSSAVQIAEQLKLPSDNVSLSFLDSITQTRVAPISRRRGRQQSDQRHAYQHSHHHHHHQHHNARPRTKLICGNHTVSQRFAACRQRRNQQTAARFSSSSDCGFSSASQNSINQSQRSPPFENSEQRKLGELYARLADLSLASSQQQQAAVASLSEANLCQEELAKLSAALLVDQARTPGSRSAATCCARNSSTAEVEAEDSTAEDTAGHDCSQLLAELMRRGNRSPPAGVRCACELACTKRAAAGPSAAREKQLSAGSCDSGHLSGLNYGDQLECGHLRSHNATLDDDSASTIRIDELADDSLRGSPKRDRGASKNYPSDQNGHQVNIDRAKVHLTAADDDSITKSLPRAFELKLTLSINPEKQSSAAVD